MRDRAAALARALTRQRQFDALRRAGRVEIEVAAGAAGARRLVLTGGRLATSPAASSPCSTATARRATPTPTRPLPRHLVDELSCVVSWLEAEAPSVRVLHCEEPWSVPVPRLPGSSR